MSHRLGEIALVAALVAIAIAGCGGGGAGSTAGRSASSGGNPSGSGSAVLGPIPATEPHHKHPDVTEEAQLVTPRAAWALTETALMLTRDGGGSWRPITPPGVEAGGIKAILFTDARHGYLVTSTDAPSLHAPLDFFRTDDGGRSWRRSATTPRQTTISGVRLAFHGDHGWALVGEQGTMGSNGGGHLYATTDAGATWRPVSPSATPVAVGSIEFVSRSEGFLEGGEGRQGLWRSTDGGRSWVPVGIDPPSGYRDAFSRNYDLPQIYADGSGLLPATFATRSGRSVVGLYVRSAPDRSWRLAKTLHFRGEPGSPNLGVFTTAGRRRLTVEVPGAKSLTIVTANLASGKAAILLSIQDENLSGLDYYRPLSFADREHALAIGRSEYCPLNVDCSRRNNVVFSGDGGRSWRPAPSRP